MNRIAIIGCCFIATALSSQPANAFDALESPGKVDAVTVYRGQAIVTRLVDIPAPAGLHELVVSDLPEQVLPASLYAESADGVEDAFPILQPFKLVSKEVKKQRSVIQVGDVAIGALL